MILETLSSLTCRTLFVLSFILVVVAVIERFVHAFGYTIVRSAYTPGRMLELAAMLLVLVVALLLRQIREELKNRKV